MTSSALDLSLPEQIVLLALRDDKGTPEFRATMHKYAIGGAILAELAFGGHVRIGEDKKNLVEPLAAFTLADPVLEECRAAVAGATRRKSAGAWVTRFARIRRLRHRVAEGICRRGILKDSEEQILLVFTRKAYPTTDPAPERLLLERMREAVLGDGDGLDPRTALVVALAHAAKMLGIYFGWKELWRRRARLKRIASGEPIDGVDRAAVAAIHAAVAGAVRRAVARAASHAHGG
jgi:hypothetical protein